MTTSNVLSLSLPWRGAAETMPIGKITNMLEIAEDGNLEFGISQLAVADRVWFPGHGDRDQDT